MSTTRRQLQRLLAPVLVVTALASLPTAALAQSEERVEAETEAARPSRADAIRQAKERAQQAIDRRLDTLDRLGDRVSNNAHITADHARSLVADFGAAQRGLAALGDEIDAADTLAGIFRLSTKIATDYRVYLVIAPKTHEVIVSDTIVDVADRFAEVANTLGEAIERADDGGYDVTEARRWLAVAEDEIGEAKRAGGPVAGDVIGLTASDWPDPAQSALRSGSSRLKNARLDLHEARAALHKSHEALREALGV